MHYTTMELHRHALCQQELETLDHLLVRCVVNREGWWRLLHRFGWHHLAPALDSSVVEWWLHTRKCVAKQRRRAFDSLVCLVSLVAAERYCL
jgi:hypothetical protein